MVDIKKTLSPNLPPGNTKGRALKKGLLVTKKGEGSWVKKERLLVKKKGSEKKDSEKKTKGCGSDKKGIPKNGFSHANM